MRLSCMSCGALVSCAVMPFYLLTTLAGDILTHGVQVLLAAGAGVLLLLVLAAVAAAALFLSRLAAEDTDAGAATARGGANRVCPDNSIFIAHSMCVSLHSSMAQLR